MLRQVGANTISVVDGVKNLLPKVFGLPPGMKLKTIFDQSTYIIAAIKSLEHEAVSGSVLASLMILVFLGSFRSTFAIFLSIPLSILAGAFGLYLNGSTINIMTLGGFALAIGRLVDNSVIVLENINRHLAEGEEPAMAVRQGADEVALSVLAITLTTCIVFFPVMFLFGVAKYLFSALALAVVLVDRGLVPDRHDGDSDLLRAFPYRRGSPVHRRPALASSPASVAVTTNSPIATKDGSVLPSTTSCRLSAA